MGLRGSEQGNGLFQGYGCLQFCQFWPNCQKGYFGFKPPAAACDGAFPLSGGVEVKEAEKRKESTYNGRSSINKG